MKLKLDENLGLGTVAFLANQGCDVMSVAAQDLCSASDDVLAEVCRAEDRCLISLDLDFANPLRFPPRRFAGIAVLRVQGKVTRAAIEAALSVFLDVAKQREVAGKLWIVEMDRVREYEDSQLEP